MYALKLYHPIFHFNEWYVNMISNNSQQFKVYIYQQSCSILVCNCLYMLFYKSFWKWNKWYSRAHYDCRNRQSTFKNRLCGLKRYFSNYIGKELYFTSLGNNKIWDTHLMHWCGSDCCNQSIKYFRTFSLPNQWINFAFNFKAKCPV